MRSFVEAAGRISLSVLLVLALCPVLGLEAFGDEPLTSAAVNDSSESLDSGSRIEKNASDKENGTCIQVTPGNLDESAAGEATATPLNATLSNDFVSLNDGMTTAPSQIAQDELLWRSCGTCEWTIDDARILIVRPANGAESGELVFGDSRAPWVGSDIVSARFEGRVVIDSCELLFWRCKDLASVDLSGLDTSSVTDMSNMFLHCESLASANLSCLNTSLVTDMSCMFQLCTSLESVNLAGIDTSSVENMQQMFNDCSSLVSADLSGLDTASVKNMSSMFFGCSSLQSVDIKGLNTSSVETMSDMFYQCSLLTSVSFANLDFASVKNTSGMFYGCSSLGSVDFSGLDFSSVENMAYMFSGCKALNSVDLTQIDTSSVKDMSSMFASCSSLEEIDLSGFDTSSVENMMGMFSGCSGITSVDVRSFDTSLVEDLGGMFRGCSSLVSIDFSNKDFSKAHRLDYMFSGCANLASVDFSNSNGSSAMSFEGMFDNCPMLSTIDFSNLNLSAAINLGSIFEGLSSLSSIDVSGLDISSARRLAWMFHDCVNLREVDLSDIHTKEVADIMWMFSGCSSLESVDLTGIVASPTIAMVDLFYGCSSLVSADLSGIRSSVTDMRDMFYGCASLAFVDLSCLDTSQVEDMSGLFKECSSLVSLDLSNFNTSQVEDFGGMFEGCDSLVHLDLSSFDTSKATNMSGMFGFSIKENLIIRIGEGFSFEGAKQSRICNFPVIYGEEHQDRIVTGMWANVGTGEIYNRDGIPSGVAASYSPQVLTRLVGTVNVLGEPCKAVCLKASVNLDSPSAELEPTLLYQWFDAETDEPLSAASELSTLPLSDDNEGTSCYCKVTTSTAGLGGAIVSDSITASHFLEDSWSFGEQGHWRECCDCGAFLAKEEHSFCDWAVDVVPTCVSAGERHRTCAICGYSEVEDIPATAHRFNGQWFSDAVCHWCVCSECGTRFDVFDHEFGSWGVLADATCTDSGEETRSCSICGWGESREIPATGHVLDEGWHHDDVLHWYECVSCGLEFNVANHLFGDWRLTKLSSCTASGEESHECIICGYIETRAVPLLDHSYGDAWLSDSAGHWRACAVCQAKGPASAHEFGEWTVTNPATCTSFGQEERVCSVCGFREAGEIPPAGHDVLDGWRSDGTFHWKACSKCDERLEADVHSFGEWGTDRPATCTEPGEESQVCSVCGYEAVNPIEPTGHVWGSLLSDGSGHWRECSSCGTKGLKSDHSFGSWATVRGSTVDVPGLEERSCSVCGYREQREIPAIDPSNPFIDVFENSTPHYDHILWLAYEGISAGWDIGGGKKEFRPWDNVARCDMAAFLYRLAGSPSFEPSAEDLAAFRDVDKSTPHCKEVLWLASTGISEGWDIGGGEREFRSYDNIARSDMAAFLHRLAIWMGAPEPGSGGRAFSDVDGSIAHAEDVAWLSAAGITTGFSDGTFRPYDSIVRCDMAAFLHRLDGYVNGYAVD